MKSTKQLTVSIRSFKRNESEYQVQGQRVLCDLSGHILANGNATLATAMVANYERVTSTNMHKWLTEYAMVTWNDESQAYEINKAKRDKLLKEYEGDDYIEYLKANAREWFKAPNRKDGKDKKEVTLLETTERKLKKGKVSVSDMQATIAFLQAQVREADLAIEAE